ncbi:MAG: hypothetical protein IPM92_12505 [Saprospiraceae bacterium]|nr:hypothetical protein [Saprospiraceae bacterium]
MKKLSLQPYLSAFVIIFMLFGLCMSNSLLAQKENGPSQQNLNPGSAAFDKIPYKDMIRMVAKYRDQRQAIINDTFSGTNPGQYGANFADSRYFTFDLQKLKDFIAAVEDQVKENNLSVNFSGLRVYPIVYPEVGTSEYSDSIPYSHRNHLSIMFVPTYRNEVGEDIDFDPDLFEVNPNGPWNAPKSLFKPENMSETDFLNWLFGQNDAVKAFTGLNHAGLCPPPNPCTSSSLLKNADVLCPINSGCQY